MKILTIWHRLLIYFLSCKNNIIENLTGIKYISKEDILEIQNWTKDQVKLVLDKLGTESDVSNCPWCILYWLRGDSKKCPGCLYQDRHQWCYNSSSDFSKITLTLRSRHTIGHNEGVSSISEIKSLINKVKLVNQILPHIL